jgi:hypothetical protein
MLLEKKLKQFGSRAAAEELNTTWGQPENRFAVEFSGLAWQL